MFNRAKRGLQSINAKSKAASDQEKKVAKNVTSSLAMSLQDLSVNFRRSQSSYLKREYCTIDAPPLLSRPRILQVSSIVRNVWWAES